MMLLNMNMNIMISWYSSILPDIHLLILLILNYIYCQNNMDEDDKNTLVAKDVVL